MFRYPFVFEVAANFGGTFLLRNKAVGGIKQVEIGAEAEHFNSIIQLIFTHKIRKANTHVKPFDGTAFFTFAFWFKLNAILRIREISINQDRGILRHQ